MWWLCGAHIVNVGAGNEPTAVLRLFRPTVSDGLEGAIDIFRTFCNYLPLLSFAMTALCSPTFHQADGINNRAIPLFPLVTFGTSPGLADVGRLSDWLRS